MIAAFFKRLKRDNSGNVSLLFGLALVPMVVATGAALDYSRASNVYATVASAADTGVLAAAASRGTAAVRQDIAQKAFEANLNTAGITGPVRVTYQNIASGSINTGFRIEAKATVKTIYGAFLGVPSTEVSAVAQAASAKEEATEVVFVLDTTGSMGGPRIAKLKTAANTVITEIMRDAQRPDLIKFGVVPFSEYVNVGMANRTAPWIDVGSDYRNRWNQWVRWNGCVGSRNFPLNTLDGGYGTKIPGILGVTCASPILDLTTNVQAVRDNINALTTGGNTYIPAGLIWGWRMLSNSAPLSAAIGGPGGARKFMILVTDGANTISPSYPAHNGNSSTLADQITKTTCNNVAGDTASAIKVYTIAFEMNGLDTKAILEECANRSGGDFFDAQDEAKLIEAFRKISDAISTVRLTQ